MTLNDMLQGAQGGHAVNNLVRAIWAVPDAAEAAIQAMIASAFGRLAIGAAPPETRSKPPPGRSRFVRLPSRTPVRCIVGGPTI